MKCMICNTENKELHFKHGVNYIKCNYCDTISTTDDIKDLVVTQNDGPNERNSDKNNSIRFARLKASFGHKPMYILDYGCGQGQFVDFLYLQNTNAMGVDTNNLDVINEIPSESLDAITMIEVLEHILDPKSLFETLEPKLVRNGLIMIETTFADHIDDIDAHSYVDPRIGHVCMLSIKALESIIPSTLKYTQLNKNVVILKKTSV